MPSSKDAKKSRNTNRLSSGIDELDHILGGGFPAKRLFLIEGAPGSGKTTLALQFLLAGVKNSQQEFYVTFSGSEDEIRAVAESHGWTLDGIDRLIGGVRWGTGLVLVGPAGTEKSTVGIQIVSAAAQQGYKTCAFLFDEAKTTYVKRGKNVDLDLAGHMHEGIIEIHQIDPNEQSPGEFE